MTTFLACACSLVEMYSPNNKYQRDHVWWVHAVDVPATAHSGVWTFKPERRVTRGFDKRSFERDNAAVLCGVLVLLMMVAGTIRRSTTSSNIIAPAPKRNDHRPALATPNRGPRWR